MKKRWNERTKLEKIIGISRIIVSLVIIYASIMKFINIWPKGLNIAIPLFALYYLLETIYNWKIDKDMAALSLIMTIIITVVSCAVFFL
jgi:hypothetical protein